MKFVINKAYILVMFLFLFLASCSTYQEEDYSDPIPYAENKSACINMDSAQEEICKEHEYKLSMDIGNKRNCRYEYAYQVNRCNREKEKQKQLSESLYKHNK